MRAHGYTHGNERELVQHVHSLLDDPWLGGNPLVQSRDERRSSRAHPPLPLVNWWIYNSDSASRQASDGEGSASYGVMQNSVLNNVVLSLVKRFKHV